MFLLNVYSFLNYNKHLWKCRQYIEKYNWKNWTRLLYGFKI